MTFQGDKKFGQSLLAGPENRLRAWLLPKVPPWIETYHLTLTTVLWSLLVLLCGFLARYSIHWLHGVSLAIALQYLTDLMDGAVGRHRDTGLVKWGFYMDHFLDYIFLLSILIAYAFLIPHAFKGMLFYVMAFFGAFMVNSFLSFAATNRFKISYGGVGPTEVRLIFMLINGLIVFFGRAALLKTLPYAMGLALFGLFVTVYRTQKALWQEDLRLKRGLPENAPVAQGDGWRALARDMRAGWRKRFVLPHLAVSLLLSLLALVVLVLRLGYPWHRVAALGLYMASWIPLALSLRTRRAVLRKHAPGLKRRVKPYLAHAVVALALLVFGRAAWLLAPPVVADLGRLDRATIETQLRVDRERLRQVHRHARSLAAWAETRLFERPLPSLTPREKEETIEAWSQTLDLALEQEALKIRYRGFYQIDYLTRPDLHAGAFGLAFSAFLGQYELSLRMANLVDAAPFVAAMLNDAHAEHNIPAGSYAAMKQRLTHPDELLRLHAGVAYKALVGKHWDAATMQDVEAMLANVYRMLGDRPARLVAAPLDWLEQNAFTAWLPFQKTMALQLSRIRPVQRDYWIDAATAADLLPLLQPGDILLQRRNWHASNAGIPGFWSHVALYVGTPTEAGKFLAGAQDVGAADKTLADAFPAAWDVWNRPGAHGRPRRVLEAVADGVVFTEFEASAHCDYLAVLRPCLSRAARGRALRNALTHFGKPYDYNFDFATDSALVCSELVYKAYAGLPDFGFELVVANGRLMLPPNRLARKFDEEFDSARRGLDLVVFLDARESGGGSFRGTEASFRASWRRPRWEPLMD
jgi:phosphatidylglycerophosphate synthase